MKLIIALLTLFIVPKECNNMSSSYNDLVKRQNDITIIYEANSRGFFEEVAVSKNTLKFCNDINRKNYVRFDLNVKDWESCLTLLSKIDLNSLSNLKAPTSMRHVDGAPHATLTVINGDKEIRSSTFDHGHPPKEIKELIDKLLTFKKQSSKQ